MNSRAPAWLWNVLVVGCVWGYCQIQRKKPTDFVRFAATFALTTAFFALDMALFQPRYLGFFRHLLHPHLP